MDGEQRFEAPNEPVRTHQKATAQLVCPDRWSLDESPEDTVGREFDPMDRTCATHPPVSGMSACFPGQPCAENCSSASLRLVSTYPRRNGIQHDIPQHTQEAGSAFDNLRLVSSLKHVADPTMAPVEPAAVRTVDVLHQPREGMHGRPQQQVHVSSSSSSIRRRDGEASGRSLEELEISSVVDIVNEHFALVVAARHDVMQHSRCVESKGAGHAVSRANAGPVAQILRISISISGNTEQSAQERQRRRQQCGQFSHGL